MNLAVNLNVASSLLSKDLSSFALTVKRWMQFVKEEYEMSVTPRIEKQLENKDKLVNSALDQLKSRFSTLDHSEVEETEENFDSGLVQLRDNVERLSELHGRLGFMMTELQGLVRRQ